MPAKLVLVEVHSDPRDPSEVGILFRSSDGSALTAQELIDALSDALIMDANIPCPIEQLNPMDYDA